MSSVYYHLFDLRSVGANARSAAVFRAWKIIATSDGKSITGLWFRDGRHLPGDVDAISSGKSAAQRNTALPVFDALETWL